MTGTVNLKCPNCRAGIGFDPSVGKFVCHYCNGVFSKEEMERFTGSADNDPAVQSGANEKDAHYSEEEHRKILPAMQLFSCPSCGAEIMTDPYTTASRCVYCGNNAIIASRLHGVNKPDYIIPFQIDRKKAISIYQKEVRGMYFIPKIFSSDATIEKIAGVYIPTWIYSGFVFMDYTGTATVTSSTSSYRYTEYKTDTYEIERKGKLIFEKVPVDASRKMDDTLMQAIEPYSYKDMLDFDMSYLSGFLADTFDENAERRAKIAEQRVYEAARGIAYNNVGASYEDLNFRYFNIDIKKMEYSYAYLPVWLLTVRFRGKLFYYAINGSTGKFAGKFPLSKGAVMKKTLFRTAIFSTIVMIIVFIMQAILFFF